METGLGDMYMVGREGKEVKIPVRRERSAKECDRSRRSRGRETRSERIDTEREAEAHKADRSNGSDTDWRDMAIRLRADMDNYRKRQKRWAQSEIFDDKVRLLTNFLDVMDNLEKTLEHLDAEDPNHQAVQLAYDGMMKLLIHEDVERIFALGRVFDPHWHDAVAMVPASADQEEEMRVVEVVNPGYRLNDRVLRPARVVVAKRERA
jgi:molecular chaperone GrpE